MDQEVPGVQICLAVSRREDSKQRQLEESSEEVRHQKGSVPLLEQFAAAFRACQVQVQVFPEAWRKVQEGALEQQAVSGEEQTG